MSSAVANGGPGLGAPTTTGAQPNRDQSPSDPKPRASNAPRRSSMLGAIGKAPLGQLKDFKMKNDEFGKVVAEDAASEEDSMENAEIGFTGADAKLSKNFRQAYLKLVDKYSKDSNPNNTMLVRSSDISEMEHEKQIRQDLEENPRILGQDFGDFFRTMIQQRMLTGAQTLKEKEDTADCTFHPTLISRKSEEKHRNLDEIIQDSYAFLEKKNAKAAERIRVANETAVQHPKTLKASERMVKDRLNQSVYVRLHTKKDDSKLMQTQQSLNQTAKTTVAANHRGRAIYFSLYDLHKARKVKLDRKRVNQDEQEDKDLSEANELGRNPKSEKHASGKFQREYDNVIANMAHDEEEWDEEKPIPYQQAGSVLTTLGFLPSQLQTDSQDFELFQSLWQVLDGEKNEGVNQANLAHALTLIRGFKYPEREVDVEAEEGREGIAKEALNNAEGELTIRKGGQARIRQFFKNLYINRLQFEGLHKKRPVKTAVVNLDAPVISDKTKAIAEESRRKYNGEQVANNIVEYLYAKEKARAEEKKELKKRYDEDRENKEQNEVTFSPATIDFEFTLDQYKRATTGGDRNIDLYSTKQKGWFAEKKEINHGDHEFNKGAAECTHHPAINHTGSHLQEAEQDLETTGGLEFAKRLALGREKANAKKEAGTESRGPLASSGKKSKQNPQMLGHPIMNTSTAPSKFQSAFGEPAPVRRRAKKPVATSTRSRKPVSFFDSQKLNRTSLLNGAAVAQEEAQEEQIEIRGEEEDEPVQQDNFAAEAGQDDEVAPAELQEMAEPNVELAEEVQDTNTSVQKEQVTEEQEPENVRAQQPHVLEDDNIQVESSPARVEDRVKDANAEEGSPETFDEREPKLYVDVNVATFGLQRIIVYEGDTVESLVEDFVKRCPIDEVMIEKLKNLLQAQMDGVLERIDEDEENKSEHSEESAKEIKEGQQFDIAQSEVLDNNQAQIEFEEEQEQEQQQEQLAEADEEQHVESAHEEEQHAEVEVEEKQHEQEAEDSEEQQEQEVEDLSDQEQQEQEVDHQQEQEVGHEEEQRHEESQSNHSEDEEPEQRRSIGSPQAQEQQSEGSLEEVPASANQHLAVDNDRRNDSPKRSVSPRKSAVQQDNEW